MLTLYGIKQCDTCRKALKWLADNGVQHRFHDLRVDGLEADRVQGWMDSPLADQLVNRRSTTWRGLTEVEKASEGKALVDLLVANPTLVKRPVFETHQVVAIGFKPNELDGLL